MTKTGGKAVGVGVVLIVLGVLALAAPLLTGIAVAILVGGMLLVGGVAMTAAAWRARAMGAGIGDLLWALLHVLVGLVVLLHPWAALASLTLLLAIFFFVAGAWKAAVAWRFRPRDGWGLLFASGVLSLLLGMMVLTSWPLSGTWAVGTLVGIELIFDGVSLLRVGHALREAGKVPLSGA
jgi:uncharacterized membrane protein HdeD (DUF308 family)